MSNKPYYNLQVQNFRSFKEFENNLEQFRDDMLARPAPVEVSFSTQA